MESELAPPPEFRLVGCAAITKPHATTLASIAFGSSMAGLAAALSCGVKQALALGLSSGAAGLFLLGRRGPKLPHGTSSVPMTIVPWGVLLDDGMRILHWPSIRKVAVEHLFARDQASDTTVASVVYVETDRARYAAHAPGEVQIDRLLAYVDDYAREAAHEVALDLECNLALSPSEPVCAPLLGRARSLVACPTKELAATLRDYRGASGARLRRSGRAELVRVLRDRTPKAVDPRPIAAILAAEYQVEEAAAALASLVQSPHPIVAATAKAAATRLGVPTARVGTVDELGPFLQEEDRDALKIWVAEGLSR